VARTGEEECVVRTGEEECVVRTGQEECVVRTGKGCVARTGGQQEGAAVGAVSAPGFGVVPFCHLQGFCRRCSIFLATYSSTVPPDQTCLVLHR